MITQGEIIYFIVSCIIMGLLCRFLIRDMNKTKDALIKWAKTVPKEEWEKEWKRNNTK